MDAAWSGTIDNFLSIREEEFVEILEDFIANYLKFDVNESHKESWADCFRFLYNKFYTLPSECRSTYLAFEYTLEDFRRPDVLIFTNEKLIILEFKNKSSYSYDNIEQALLYREDIKKYHKANVSLKLEVLSFLVLTKGENTDEEVDTIKILTKNNFISTLKPLMQVPLKPAGVLEWLTSNFEPLPSIAESAMNLFKHGYLPQIKNISDGEINATVKAIKTIIHKNQTSNKNKSIIFVSGVPGSGKTLVALKVLYDYATYICRVYKKTNSAIYLSGNDALVKVLQSILEDGRDNKGLAKEGTYIRRLLQYLSFYELQSKTPSHNVLLLDEMQRAWDKSKYKHDYSEAEAILILGEKIYERQENITLVCFIGDGQEIHEGEENGISLWQMALANRKNKNWNIYVPSKYAQLFSGCGKLLIYDSLNLNHSIRGHFIDLTNWIEDILIGNFKQSSPTLNNLYNNGFSIRITRDFNKCKQYLMQKESEQGRATYGIIMSSKADVKKIKDFIGHISFSSYMDTKSDEIPKWYNGESKDFHKAASEFACQGLELDYPILCFGGDLYFTGSKWAIDNNVSEKYNSKFRDFYKIMINIYRVLLSRGRRGIVLFVPPISILDKTYEALLDSGIRTL